MHQQDEVWLNEKSCCLEFRAVSWLILPEVTWSELGVLLCCVFSVELLPHGPSGLHTEDFLWLRTQGFQLLDFCSRWL